MYPDSDLLVMLESHEQQISINVVFAHTFFSAITQ